MSTFKQREQRNLRIHKMFDSGKSVSEVATTLGLSPLTIADVRREWLALQREKKGVKKTPPPYARNYRWGAGW